MSELEKLLDDLVERKYQLRLEHNHYDMKWYAYYAGRDQRKLHDDDIDWETASDTPLEAVQSLHKLMVEPQADGACSPVTQGVGDSSPPVASGV